MVAGAGPFIKEVRMANSPPALGASAAVNAIVMLSILLYPRRMVYLYAVLPVPAAVLGVIYIGGDMLGLLGVRAMMQSCYAQAALYTASGMHAPMSPAVADQWCATKFKPMQSLSNKQQECMKHKALSPLTNKILQP